MVTIYSEIVKILEGIVERLDEVVTDTALIDIDDRVDYEEEDYSTDIEDNRDRLEAAHIITDSRINEITQVVNEEIDNIRKLVEIIAQRSE